MGNTHGEGLQSFGTDVVSQITIEAKSNQAESVVQGVSDPKNYSLIINAKPERDSVAFNQNISKFIGMVDIEAPLFEDAERAPIDIYCVVDTSGSMSGDRISLLRKSLRRLVRGVQSKDRLALVEFASSYQVLLELTKMDEKGKDKAKKIVKKLRASGGTHLSGGLLQGLKMVKKRVPATANEVCSILLFTDGEANSGIRDTAGILAAAEQEAGMGKFGKVMPGGDPEKWSVDDVCQWLAYKELDLEDLVTNVKKMKIDGQILMHDLTEDMLEEDLKVSRLHTAKFLREIEKLREGEEAQEKQLDCTINTFGYGSSHNSDLLEKLAERFDGMYYFIKDTDAINEGFATCLGGLMSTVATNLQLSLTPLNGAKKVHILNDFVVKTQDGVTTATLGDIQSEEKRHILFEVDLPEAKAEIGSDTYCSVKLSYENTISSKTNVLLSLMEVKREKVTGKRDEMVDEQYNRVVVAQALHNADELGRVGQLEQARASLDHAMVTVRSSRSSCTPMSRNLVSDMTETKKGYASIKDYRKWGKNYTKQNRSCYRRERSVLVSDRSNQYATQRTYVNVSKIKAVTQFNNSCSDDSDSADEVLSKHRTRAVSLRSIEAPKTKTPKPRQSVYARSKIRTPASASTRVRSRRSNKKTKGRTNQKNQYVDFRDFMSKNTKSTPKAKRKPASPKPAKAKPVSLKPAVVPQSKVQVKFMPPTERMDKLKPKRINGSPEISKPESHKDTKAITATPVKPQVPGSPINVPQSSQLRNTNTRTNTNESEEMKHSASDERETKQNEEMKDSRII